MLTPKFIELQNFVSYIGTHKLKYTKGPVLIEGVDYDQNPPGSIGSGKTALAGYAPTWCLFGRLPTEGFVADDVINRYTDKACQVTMLMEGKGDRLLVERTRGKGKTTLKIEINGQAVSGDIAEKQRILEDFLRIDWGLWNSTVYLSPSSNLKSFLECSPAQRMKILSQVINDTIYQEAAKKLNRKIGDNEREVMKLRGQSEMYTASIQKLETQLSILQQNLAEESRRVREVQTLTDKDSAAIEMEILKIQEEIRRGPGVGVSHNQVQQQLADASGKLQVLHKEMGGIDYRLRALPNLSTGRCPTCSQNVTQDYVQIFANETAILRNRLQQLQREVAVLQQHREELETVYASFNQWPQKEAVLRGQIETLKLRAFVNRSGVDNSLVIQYTNQVNILEGQIDNYRKELSQVEEQIYQIVTLTERQKVVHAGLSKDIRYMMIDTFRQVMEFYANANLNLLGKEGWSLAFQSDKGEVEAFKIIPSYLGERMELPSKGQRHKFSIAVTLGLIRALTHQRPHKVGMLIMDDAIGDLDLNGQREVGSLLRGISETIPVVLLTVPQNSDFGDFQTLTVHHKNSESKIHKG